MATADELFAVVGSPVGSVGVQALVEADGLVASDESEGWSVARRSYLSGSAAGYALTHTLGRVVTAVLYAEPAEGFAAFPAALPGGLSRRATRQDVLARFVTPERSGEATTITGLGPQGAWDRFAVGGLRVHFQYIVAGESIRLVSVMAFDVAP